MTSSACSAFGRQAERLAATAPRAGSVAGAVAGGGRVRSSSASGSIVATQNSADAQVRVAPAVACR